MNHRLTILPVLLASALAASFTPACRKHGNAAAHGEVVVYTSVDEVFARPIADRFQRETGITVRLVPDTEETKSTGLVNRLIAESSRPQADVFWSGDPVRAAILKKRGVSAAYRSPRAEGLPARFSDPEGYWTGFSARARVLIYNLNLVAETEQPRRVLDLLGERWRGQVCIANPLFGTTSMHAAALFSAWGDEQARAFFEGLTANGGRMLSSNGEVRRRVSLGEFAVGITDTDDANVAHLEGQPIGVAFPDAAGLGTLLIPNCAVLIAGAPHPENARRFIDYLLSPEVEQALASSEAAQIPLRPGVPGPQQFPSLERIHPMAVDYSVLAGVLETLSSGFLKSWGRSKQRMISSAILEQPGRWRGLMISGILALAILPGLPLGFHALTSAASLSGALDHSFRTALGNTLIIAALVLALSLAVGLPLGVLSALYTFRGKPVLMAALGLPLVVPTFLWAIGWSMVGPAVISGIPGTVLVFLAPAAALVMFTCHAVTCSLSDSQVAGARLAGGECCLLRHAVRHAAIPAALAAALSVALVLSDPGPGLILGTRTAAAEILTSFSAVHDLAGAGRQALVVAVLVLLVVVPSAWSAAPNLAWAWSARQTRRNTSRYVRGGSGAVAMLLVTFAASFVGLPLAGLLLPLARSAPLQRAASELLRTAADTGFFAAGAAVIAVGMGLVLAIAVGRSPRRRALCLSVCVVLLALPPSFAALGVVSIAAQAPAWTDFLLRSRLTVCAMLGLRFMPVATVLFLHAWGSTAPSWALAAGQHGVGLWRYLRCVAVPLLGRSAGCAAVVVALLASADVVTMLLLHPPGHGSMSLSIFTVMANAPQGLVASMCLLYVVVSALLLALVWWLARASTRFS